MKVMQVVLLYALLFGFPSHANPAENLEMEVRKVEAAFANTMLDRDLQAFASFLSDEAIFLSGGTTSRGKELIVKQWKQYYDAENIPFTWQPETIVVLDSGTLALSSGPFYNSEGKIIANFNSIWRREKSGHWKI